MLMNFCKTVFSLATIFCLLSGNLFAQQAISRPRQAGNPGGNVMPSRDPFHSGEEFVAKNQIERLFVQSLRKHNINPAPICSDEVFLRRVYLDLIGNLPTPQEARDFFEDKREAKRARLIETLLARDEFLDLQAMRWCDVLRVKAEFPINLWPNGAACYYRWIHRSLELEMSYDRFARELLTASGSNFRDGASNFYRAVPANDSDTLAEAVFRTFLGFEIGSWPEEKRKQAAIFFSRLGYKETAQWKEEIVFWDRKPLDVDILVFPDETSLKYDPDLDPREIFADWLINPKNTEFNRVAVNRVWSWLFGRGLMPDPEDANTKIGQQPIHPELLDALCAELVNSKYDLKHIYRLILNSGIYQQSSITTDDNSEAVALFAAYPVRRIEAEVFQDVLARIFELPVGYVSEVPEPFTYIPLYRRTVLLPDSSITSPFLEMFGRASRDTGADSDRNNEVTESQQLFLLNSTELNTWIGRFMNRNRIERRPAFYRDMMDELWLIFLSRYPSEGEYRIVAAEMRDRSKPAPQKIQDIIWCLLNTKEFLCKH